MPKILKERHLFKGKIFNVKQLDVQFNKSKHKFEILDPNGRQSVIVVPVDSQNRIVLIKNFAAAFNRFELFPPQGLIDEGETASHAAQRECQEEAGVKPRKLIHLASVTASPAYSRHSQEIFLGLDLINSKLQGDEPDELEVVRVPLKNIHNIIQQKKITHASSIAALLLAEKYLKKNKT